jgi:hypothetical protein
MPARLRWGNTSSAIARSTRSRAESLTGRERLTTCETVVKDTPARAATCLMVLTEPFAA